MPINMDIEYPKVVNDKMRLISENVRLKKLIRELIKFGELDDIEFTTGLDTAYFKQLLKEIKEAIA